MRLTDYQESAGRIHLAVNGARVPFESHRIFANDSGDEWLVFDNPGLTTGNNSVLLMLEGSSTPRPWPALRNLEVMVICS